MLLRGGTRRLQLCCSAGEEVATSGRKRASGVVSEDVGETDCAAMIDNTEYEQRGFAIERGIFNGAELASLQAAADRFVSQVRRVYESADTHRFDLLDPKLKPHHEYELLNCLDGPNVLGVSERISGSRLWGSAYYINVDSPSMCWHQDFEYLPKELPEEFNLQEFREQTPSSQIQWNLALHDDAVLFIVPGTHRGTLAPQVQEMLASNRQRPAELQDIPGALCVALKAGDGIVYHNNLIHGVSNPNLVKRRTLHWYWVIQGQDDPYDYHRSHIDDDQRPLISPRLFGTADAS